MLKHIEQLETERTAALNEARSYLIKGTRNMAKTSLRKKHELEHIIEKKVMALENVRILLNQLNDSGLDAQVLESYKKGASVLKAVLKDSGLTEESVSSTMLQLEETCLRPPPYTPSAPLIPQSSEKVAAHPPDKEGDRENKERRHKGQQREHAGRDYLCKVIHKVLDVNQEIQAILSQPIGSSTDKDLEEELAALLESSGSSGPSDNTLHYTGGEFEGNHKEAPSPPFTAVYILDEEKARDLTKGPLIVTRLAGR
uniref:Charged multivesicular body protein 6 n=1 Tax=Timema shepardi TaxID=629360 RepID=A0A7R9AYR4_TIMSH|nr:unnamed protein product [Timema shepardi]